MRHNQSIRLFLAIITLLVVSVVATYANDNPPIFVQSANISLPPLTIDDTYKIRYGDIDDDGDTDIVVGGDSIQIWVNDGNFQFNVSQVFTQTEGAYTVQLGDLNGDDSLDIFAAATLSTSMPNPPDRVFLNDGNGIFTMTTQELGDSASIDVTLVDIDIDGDLDAVVSACFWPISFAFDSEDRIWLNDGTGEFVDSGLDLDESCTIELATGDFNGDMRPDILRYSSAGFNVNQVELLLNEGDGELAFEKVDLFQLNDPRWAVSDLNGDGFADMLLLSDQNSETVPNGNNVWLNDGTGNLQNTGQSLGSTSSSYLIAIDFDRDGDTDVVTTDADRITQHVWMNMGDGFFLHVDQFTVGQQLFPLEQSSVAADFNGDMWEDLLFATYGGIEIWENQQYSPIEAVRLFLPVVSRQNGGMLNVIVLTTVWNQIGKTVACLTTVAAQDFAAFETVVVDNGSNDNSAEIIIDQFPTVTLIQNENNLGFAGGYNVGLSYALDQQFDYLLLINNDTLLAPDCLSQLVKTAQQLPDAGLLTAKIYYAEAPEVIWSVGAKTHPILLEINDNGNHQHDSGQWERVEPIDFAPLCGVLLSRQMLETVGLLDDNYFLYYEDMDFCQRIREAGYGLYLAPEAKMWHAVSASSGGSDSSAERYFMAQSSGRYFRKNASWKQLLFIIPYRFGSALRTTWRLLRRGNIKPIAAYWVGLVRGWLTADATHRPPTWLTRQTVDRWVTILSSNFRPKYEKFSDW